MTKITLSEKLLVKNRDDLVRHMESLDGSFKCVVNEEGVPIPKAHARISYEYKRKKEVIKGMREGAIFKEGEDVSVRVIFDRFEGHTRMTVMGNLESTLGSHESIIRAGRLYHEVGSYGRTHGEPLLVPTVREATVCGIPIERYLFRD